MNQDHLKEQMRLSKEALKQMKSTLSMFDVALQGALVVAPEDHKMKVEKVRASCNKIMNLAKQGRTEEVNNLINELKEQWESK